jgi:hypothetical protein
MAAGLRLSTGPQDHDGPPKLGYCSVPVFLSRGGHGRLDELMRWLRMRFDRDSCATCCGTLGRQEDDQSSLS